MYSVRKYLYDKGMSAHVSLFHLNQTWRHDKRFVIPPFCCWKYILKNHQTETLDISHFVGVRLTKEHVELIKKCKKSQCSFGQTDCVIRKLNAACVQNTTGFAR
jgi:hypothetical protein